MHPTEESFVADFTSSLILHLNTSNERAAEATHVRQVVRDMREVTNQDELVTLLANALIDANERSYQLQFKILDVVERSYPDRYAELFDKVVMQNHRNKTTA